MRAHLTAYAATLIVFVGLDFVWLSNAAGAIYRPALGDLMLERPVMSAAVAFYVLYLVGLCTLIVTPALEGPGWSSALWRGALFGLVAYGTYDLTNMATLRGWSPTVTILDLIWGTLLTAAAATAGVLAGSWMAR